MEKTNKGMITCPKCGHKQEMDIPDNRCIAFYKCEGCGQLIKAEESCCVFCDYGDKPCPTGHKKEEEWKR